ncbi:MAG: extracellular solute-binding protein [Anaerolineales bacterium]|nr:extracellular solute-binding protein [Anaerolineales bacterium]
MQPNLKKLALWFLTALLFSGCDIAAEEIAEATVGTPPPATATLAVTIVTPEPVQELVLWVAPAYAPDQDTEASAIFTARLDAFIEAHPNVSLIVRTKSNQGDSGLLQTLISANLAAPDTLPDLVTLDQETLAGAAAEGILLPLQDWGDPPTDEEWYDFSVVSARTENIYYGLPFAGDVDVFAYRSARFNDIPLTWERLLDENNTFCWPLADPLAGLTIGEYRLLGGELADGEGQRILQPGPLSTVLAFYADAQQAQLLPPFTLTAASSEACWEALSIDQVSAGVVPLENIVHQVGSSLSAVPIPSRSESGLSFVNTWSWALTSQRPERIALAGELAAWLSDPPFVGEWSQALGYLPARASALATWDDERQLALASSLVTLASAHPSFEFLSPYSAAITTAIGDVLTRDISPAAAASTAARSIQE